MIIEINSQILIPGDSKVFVMSHSVDKKEVKRHEKAMDKVSYIRKTLDAFIIHNRNIPLRCPNT